MISVSRSPAAAQLGIFLKESVKAADGKTFVTPHQREREAAIAFFCNPQHYEYGKKKTKRRFAFGVYKDKALAEILWRDFLGKCGYCESLFAAVTPADIEHFRPKSSVGQGKSEHKPGYYWLAGDLDNLLLSCPDCNRARTHEVPGLSVGILLGKGSQFPLSDETKRVRQHGEDIGQEAGLRLLLHPCLDQPDAHLRFDEQGLVRPVASGAAGRMAKVSIDVYALQRKHLVEARRAEISHLRSLVDDLERLVRSYNGLVALPGDTAALRADAKDHIGKCLRSIRGRLVPTAIYVAAKRDWLKAAAAEGRFEALKQFGIHLELFLALNPEGQLPDGA